MRIVDIIGLDTQADGGTHVFSTRQIGHLTIAKVENKGRQNRRVRIRLADA
jgi:misacylated tRNA(Ala) deacylase